MKKFLSISLALVMLFALIPTALSASAETAVKDLTSSEVGLYSMKNWQGTLTATKGTDTDDFIVKATNSTGFSKTDVAFRLSLPSSIYDLDLTKVTIKTKASVAIKLDVAIAAGTWAQSAPTPQVAIGTRSYTANSFVTYTITGDNLETMKTNKFSSVWFKVRSTTSSASDTFYVNSVSVEYNEAATGAPTTDAVATEEAASIRLNDQNGIRFYTTVDEAKLAELVGGNDYEIGTLIAPADALGEDGELTETDDCLEVPYLAKDEETGKYDYFNADNKEIVGSIVNIRETEKDGDGDTNGNIDREFVGRAYVKVINGEESTYYFSATTSTRSLAQVAYLYKASEGYVENENVEKWAAEYVVPQA